MNPYQTILVAIDFSEHSEQALIRAKQVAETYQASLEVLHVTELPTYPVLEDMAVTGMPGIWDDEMADKLYAAAVKRLHDMALTVGLTTEQCHVVIGSPKSEILARAHDSNTDLIVVGRRGLSGIQRLIGSTADAILHDAACDVLAVNLQDVE